MSQQLMGTALTVQMFRLHGGELGTSVGIEGNAEVRTEALEFCEIERHSDGCSILPAHLLLPIFGSFEPVGVLPGQLVTVLHSGFDLFVIPGAVPALGYSFSSEKAH